MMTNQAYQKAIDLLMGNAVDYKLLSITLAKKFPDIFVELCTNTATIEKWAKVAVDFMISGNKVGAIKECRNATGFGLKESKDVMDYVQDLLAGRGYGIPYGSSCNPLSPELFDVYEKFESYVNNNVPTKSRGVF